MDGDHHVGDPEDSGGAAKRKREPSVLDNFVRLTNGVERVRVRGGVELLRHLTAEEEGDDELKYALGRLVRGLGSAKLQTRTGFFAALVALLNLKNVTMEELFEQVAKELHKGGGNSKSENADICSGQILVAGAIFRSNLYERCTDEEKGKVLELLLNAGKERTYLNLASYKFLTELYKKIDVREFEKIVLPAIKSELMKPWPEQNLDSLYLLVETQNSFPNVIKSKFLKNNLSTREILCKDSLTELCDTLTTIPRVLALKHPIFDLFIKKISDSDLIVEFFDTLDTTLARPNRNKYFVATKLLTGVLESLQDTSLIPNMLTKNYLQQTINTYKTAVGKSKDKEFQQCTKRLFETLLAALKREQKAKVKIRVLKRLLFYPGTFIFEKVTKSKLVQNITSTLNADGVKRLAAVYSDVVVAKEERVVSEHRTEKWWNMDRTYASHLLSKLLNHPSVHDENEWKIEQLVFLMKLGLFRDENGQELADSFKENFYSSLELKLSKLDDLRHILSKIVNNLDENIKEDNLETAMRHPLSVEIFETWQQTVKMCTKLETTTDKKKVVFHILFLHLGLQLFNHVKLASESLKELFSCYDRVKKGKKANQETNTEDPLWIEVVVDLFLNLLSHNSHLLRSVINCVFPHLCPHMNATAIHQILAVLDPKNENNPLSKPGEESDEEVSDEEASEEDEESSENEENDDEEEDDDDNVNDRLRMALQQALGDNADSDAESVDLEKLDDEEGERLNQALSEAFKQFKPNSGRTKKKQNKDEETLTHFRIRVLDLLEIYLNSNPSMFLSLEIMLPLLQILEFCIRDDHQRPLQDRVRHCLKKLSSLKKFDDYEDVTDQILVDLLRSLLDKGTKNAIIIQDMGEKIAECCIFVINCSQIVSKNKEITGVIKGGLEAFFRKRDCLIPYGLFKGVIQLNWEGIIELVPLLTSFVFTDAIRPFRRNQAIELLKIFTNNQRFINSHEESVGSLQEDIDDFLTESVEFFREFSNNPSERKVREKFIGNLFELLSSLKNSVFGSRFNNWGTIGDVARECRSQITLSKDTKSAFNKLCKNLNVSNVVQMKEKALKLHNDDEEAVKEGVEKKEKKKRRKNADKEKMKMKKESKELRLQSLSEGFGKRKVNWEDAPVESKKIKDS